MSQESAANKEKYGTGRFNESLLMARRLVEGAHDIGQRGGAEEVLLLEPQLQAGGEFVYGVKHLGDVLGEVLVLDRGQVVAGVEVGEVELLEGAPRPTTVRASTDVIALRLDGPAFRALVAHLRDFPLRLVDERTDRHALDGLQEERDAPRRRPRSSAGWTN